MKLSNITRKILKALAGMKSSHLGLPVGGIAVVIGRVGQDNYILDNQVKQDGTQSHKGYNLMLVRAGQFSNSTSKEIKMGDFGNYSGYAKDPEVAVEEARERLATAEAALAAKLERKAFTDSINREIRCANAEVQALSDARGIYEQGNMPAARADYIEFRKELTVVLAHFGYKIVPVGNKTRGMVVQA